MNPKITIQGRNIGLDFDPLIIAEIGINHGGSLDAAIQMVDAAFSAGAEVVKHQTHVVDDEMSRDAKSVIPGNADASIYEIMAECALSEKEEVKLQNYVNSKGMIFLSTPFSRAAAERLRRMEVPAYKIGSGECNNYPLIEHVASFGKPMILSTGMNSVESIRVAVQILRDKRVPYALLHCTNIYPTPFHLVRLGAIQELSREFPDAVVGLSDHTVNNYACMGAVSLGASILERHFTDSMDRKGPDIICSMDPKALHELICASKVIKQARGGAKGPVLEEKPTIDFAFASVVTIADVKAGEAFSRDNIWVKRPGTGEFRAAEYNSLLRKRASRDILRDSQLRRSDIDC